MSRYRKDNKFRKAWLGATPQQRNAFRNAFKEAEDRLAKAKGDLAPVQERLEKAWEAIYQDDEPVCLACLMYEMQVLDEHAPEAFDDLMGCLGPGWLDEE